MQNPSKLAENRSSVDRDRSGSSFCDSNSCIPRRVGNMSFELFRYPGGFPGVSLKPLTTSTACSVNTFAELWPMLASTLSFWEWEVPSTALIV